MITLVKELFDNNPKVKVSYINTLKKHVLEDICEKYNLSLNTKKDALPFDSKDKILKKEKKDNNDDLLYKIYMEFLDDKIEVDRQITDYDERIEYINEWVDNYFNPDYNYHYDIKIIDNIIQLGGGVFKCIENYIDTYGEFHFSKVEEENKRICAYLVLNNYITDKVNDMNAISDAITDNWNYIQ